MAGDDKDRLPGLIDQAGIRREMGVSEATAEAIFRTLAVIRIPGHRKAFVRRAAVIELIERSEGDERRRAI